MNNMSDSDYDSGDEHDDTFETKERKEDIDEVASVQTSLSLDNLWSAVLKFFKKDENKINIVPYLTDHLHDGLKVNNVGTVIQPCNFTLLQAVLSLDGFFFYCGYNKKKLTVSAYLRTLKVKRVKNNNNEYVRLRELLRTSNSKQNIADCVMYVLYDLSKDDFEFLLSTRERTKNMLYLYFCMQSLADKRFAPCDHILTRAFSKNTLDASVLHSMTFNIGDESFAFCVHDEQLMSYIIRHSCGFFADLTEIKKNVKIGYGMNMELKNGSKLAPTTKRMIKILTQLPLNMIKAIFDKLSVQDLCYVTTVYAHNVYEATQFETEEDFQQKKDYMRQQRIEAEKIAAKIAAITNSFGDEEEVELRRIIFQYTGSKKQYK